MVTVSRPHRMLQNVMIKCLDFGIQQIWAPILALLLINYVTLGDFLKLTGPHFLCLYELCVPHKFVLRVKKDDAHAAINSPWCLGSAQCLPAVALVVICTSRKSSLSPQVCIPCTSLPVPKISRAAYCTRLLVSLIEFVDLYLFVDRGSYKKYQNY